MIECERTRDLSGEVAPRGVYNTMAALSGGLGGAQAGRMEMLNQKTTSLERRGGRR